MKWPLQLFQSTKIGDILNTCDRNTTFQPGLRFYIVLSCIVQLICGNKSNNSK